uniref:EMC6-like membrane protein n=1 Tax=Halopenitus sp. POP-27 TaxID=2994425 RepID=UPI0024690645
MSDDSGITGHARSVVVTTIACLAGIGAGIASASYVGTAPADAGSTTALFVLAGFVAVQFPILKVVGVDVTDFGVKDTLYVAFMTFTLWFISYAVVLVWGV